MKKKILLIIAGLVALALIFIVFSVIIKKIKAVSPPKKGAAVSQSYLYNQALGLETKGELLEAKGLYQKLINEFFNSSDIVNWQKKIENINIKLLFSSQVVPGSILYEVKPSDTLIKIAQEFKTTVELIKKANNLTSDIITPGKKLKVWKIPFSIVVDKSQNVLFLKTNEEVVKSYIVSTGLNNCTPVGTFKIVNKLAQPTWFKPGVTTPIPGGSPENILGSRWLGIDRAGYGIHGTNDPKTLGQQVTQGCVRMANPDVEELYLIVPIGTEVTVLD